MFLFSLLPYKFGWADVELFFKMFGEYLGGVIPQGLILNLERTLFIRHQNGCLTKNCY